MKEYDVIAVGSGSAMNIVDPMLQKDQSLKILGAHIIGPHASVLIQEIINLMYTSDQNARPLLNAMHIHPALNEVVHRAFNSLMSPEEYHHEAPHEP